MGFGVRGSEEPAGSSARSLLPCPVAETVWPPSETPHPPPTASGTQFSRAWVWSFYVLVGGAPRSLPPPAVADFPWHDGLQVHAPVAGGKTFYLFQGRVILRGAHVLRPRPPGRRGRLGRSRAVVDAGRRPRPEGAIPCPRAHSRSGIAGRAAIPSGAFPAGRAPRPPPRPLHRTRSPPGRGFRVLRALASPCFAAGASLAGRRSAPALTRCPRAQPAPRTPTAREAVAALSEEPATAGSSRCFPPSRGERVSPESARPRCPRETPLGVCPSHRPSCGIHGRGEGGLWAASSRPGQAAPGPVCLPCGSSTRLLPQRPSHYPPVRAWGPGAGARCRRSHCSDPCPGGSRTHLTPTL